jgi:hypothetical protein
MLEKLERPLPATWEEQRQRILSAVYPEAKVRPFFRVSGARLEA